MKKKDSFIGCFLVCAGVWAGAAAIGAESPADLSFRTVSDGGIEFNTGVLRGKLGADGKTKGLSSVIHIPTGTRLDASMGLLSHYRVFTVGKRYGTGAWDWPGKVSVRPDGSAEIRWEEQPDRPFGMEAVYRWAAPNVIELETTVHALTNLPGFEVFLASYFSSAFSNSLVYARPVEGQGSGPGLVPALSARGDWQVFPRDAKCLTIIQDGRWKLEPHPVDWKVISELVAPVGVRRAPHNDLAAMISSSPEDCFAIYTPQQTDSHYSMYLSLFGRDIRSGETARAKARLLITSQLTDEDFKASSRRIIKEVHPRTVKEAEARPLRARE